MGSGARGARRSIGNHYAKQKQDELDRGQAASPGNLRRSHDSRTALLPKAHEFAGIDVRIFSPRIPPLPPVLDRRTPLRWPAVLGSPGASVWPVRRVRAGRGAGVRVMVVVASETLHSRRFTPGAVTTRGRIRARKRALAVVQSVDSTIVTFKPGGRQATLPSLSAQVFPDEGIVSEAGVADSEHEHERRVASTTRKKRGKRPQLDDKSHQRRILWGVILPALHRRVPSVCL